MVRPLFVTLIILGVTASVVAQAPPFSDEKLDGTGDILAVTPHPLDRKAAARAKFTVAQTDNRELARAKLEAARIAYEGRFKEFLVGRGTLDFMLEAFLQYTQAGTALSNEPAAQAAYHEALWLSTYAAEHINRRRAEAGRIGVQDLAQARAARLHAELLLHEFWSQHGLKGFRAVTLPDYFTDVNGLTSEHQELAKAKFQATRSEKASLIEAWHNALRLQTAERFKEFLAGRGTLDFLLEAAVDLAHAKLWGNNDPAERLGIFGTLWLHARECERINRFRFETGRISIQDLAESQHFRAQAEIILLEGLAAHRQAKGGPIKLDSGLPLLFSDREPDYLKYLAQDKRRALDEDPRQLQRVKLQAARSECDARGKEFLAGRGTLVFQLDAAWRLLEAELAVGDSANSLNRHWLRSYYCEQVNEARYQAGHIPITDYMETRYQWLDAVLWLKQFQADQKRPPIAPRRTRLAASLTDECNSPPEVRSCCVR